VPPELRSLSFFKTPAKKESSDKLGKKNFKEKSENALKQAILQEFSAH